MSCSIVELDRCAERCDQLNPCSPGVTPQALAGTSKKLDRAGLVQRRIVAAPLVMVVAAASTS
jgi:DNA-binding HxlR family transcriptional regulator